MLLNSARSCLKINAKLPFSGWALQLLIQGLGSDVLLSILDQTAYVMFGGGVGEELLRKSVWDSNLGI